jgi:hypothetical protein
MNQVESDLEISDYAIREDGHGSNELIGIVANNSDRLYHYVEVQFNAYDNEGYQVDSVVASVNNLEPHGRWKFQTPVSRHGLKVKLIRVIGDDGEIESSHIFA